jgi:hypothetical protein
MLYTDIKTTAIAYSDRTTDPEITANMDLFLRLVEAPINRVLATQDMSFKVQTATIANQEFYSLPADFLSMRAVRLWDTVNITTRRTLELLSPQLADTQSQWPGGGFYYNVSGNNIQLLPIPTTVQVLEMEYYARVIPLDSVNSSNWISILHPDVYIFGLLVEINSFAKDPQAASLWADRFRTALAEIKVQDKTSLFSGTPMTTRVG